MKLELEQFTQETLKVAGWYYFIPPPSPNSDCTDIKAWHHHHNRQPEGFINLAQDTIDDGDLRCPKYTGSYIGPYPIPTLNRTNARKTEDA